MTTTYPVLSVIVPCYNEEEVILECHSRLTSALDDLNEPYEIVYVNDGSKDRTPELLRFLHSTDQRVNVVLLSRNFGHQRAVSAGLAQARGAAVVIIDADLQDPPEVIGEMLHCWRQGYEVVYGVRESREGESAFKLWTARLFYRLISRLSDVEIPVDAGDFRLLDRKVVDALLSMPERQRLLRAMCSWVGFRQCPLTYKRAARFAGTTKYPLKKMLALAMDGIVSFSTVPLRLVTFIGFLAATLSFLAVGYSVAVRLFTHEWVRGWFTVFFGTVFIGSVQMISLGVLGEYIGRIYNEIKQRPLFLLDQVLQHQHAHAEIPERRLQLLPERASAAGRIRMRS
jgi:dolichol-phosphate mannosyltransferase